MADVFLSHSFNDKPLVGEIRARLEAEGFSVCVDMDILPEVRPGEVTAKTAQTLRDAMRSCSALLYVISTHCLSSRWMPWELGYFDGFRGRVFVYPVDAAAERHARGIEYLRVYPKVPQRGRTAYLLKHVPQERAATEATELLAGLAARNAAVRPPMFDHADLLATGDYGGKLRQAATDPAQMIAALGEMTTAWLRLWGLAPNAERPGAKEGPWKP